MSGILTNCFRQSLLAVRQQAVPKAGLVYGPPRVKVSKAEKYGLGAIMVSLIILPAGYILSSLKHYQK